MAAAAQAPSDRITARRRDIALLLVLPLLAGCGRTRLDGKVAAAAMGPPPAKLLVLADGGQAIAGGDDPALVSRTARTLTETIVQDLQRHGIPAGIATTAGAAPNAAPDSARLSLVLHRVEEGSGLQRMALGSGLGQSRIEVAVRLYPVGASSAPQDLLAFHGSAHGGDPRGLVMPIGVGLGAQGAMAIAGAGDVAVVTMRGRGLSQDVRDLTEAVVACVAAFYRWAGWEPQAEPPSLDGESALAGPGVAVPRRG